MSIELINADELLTSSKQRTTDARDRTTVEFGL